MNIDITGPDKFKYYLNKVEPKQDKVDPYKPATVCPQEFNLPGSEAIICPLTVTEAVNKEYSTRKYYHGPVSIGLSALVDDLTTQEDQAWLTSAPPYSLLASDQYLFLYSSTLKDPRQTLADLQICRLEYDPKTGCIQRLIRDVTPGVFKVAMVSFPGSTLIGRIREAAGISQPSGRDYEEYQRLIGEVNQSQRSREELLKLSNHNLTSATLIEDRQNSKQILKVGQAEYAVATSEEFKWLVTFGAADCFIISIYDPANKQGALTHIDGLTDTIGTLYGIDYALGIKKNKNAESTANKRYLVTISGGSEATAVEMGKTYEFIKSWQSKTVELDIQVGKVFKSSGESLALDLDTGEVQAFFPLSQSPKEGSLESLRMSVRAFEGKKPATLTGSK